MEDIKSPVGVTTVIEIKMTITKDTGPNRMSLEEIISTRTYDPEAAIYFIKRHYGGHF